MTEKGPPRRLVLGGVVYVILGVLGTVVAGDTPDFVGDSAEIAAFYKEESNSVLASQSLYLLAGFFLRDNFIWINLHRLNFLLIELVLRKECEGMVAPFAPRGQIPA